MLRFWILTSATHERIYESCAETINLKYQKQHEMKNVNYLMDLILYQIIRANLSTSSKSTNQWQINHYFKYLSTIFRIKHIQN